MFSRKEAVMPTKDPKFIKVPKEVHKRLQRLAAEYIESHENGHRVKVRKVDIGGTQMVPLHGVITKALDLLEAHRARSNRRKKK
jgi:hypothetical protein